MQTLNNFELIIIDDNSSDNTETIIDNYKDSRIRFLRNDQKLGPEGNWNRCLTEAHGQYFKLLPQDDLLAPNCLEREVNVLKADKDEYIALVFCARTVIDSTGHAIMTRGYPQRQGGRISNQAAIRACLRHGTNLIGEPGGVMFRKSLVDAVGGFDASIGYVIDLDYWFRLLMRGDAYYVPEKLVSFRISSGSWSVAIGNKQKEDFKKLISKVSADPAYEVGIADIMAGNAMARANNLLRMCLYRFFLSRR